MPFRAGRTLWLKRTGYWPAVSADAHTGMIPRKGVMISAILLYICKKNNYGLTNQKAQRN